MNRIRSNRRVHWHIAWRYFTSQRQKSVINIISRISLGGIIVCAFALVVVLSVYNGIGQLTQSLFNVFDPELIVEPAEGKSFSLQTETYAKLTELDGVESVSELVEEKAWMTQGERQAIVQLRGVDATYARQTGLDTLIQYGGYFTPATTEEKLPEVVLGSGIYYSIGINSYSNTPVALHIPKRNASIGFSMQEAFNTRYAIPSGCFFIQQDIDNRYAVTDIATMRSLLDYGPDECSALSVALKQNANVGKVKESLAFLLNQTGTAFSIKDRFEQQPLYYKIFRSERLAIYLILALITIISTFTLVASLALLIIDKRHDSNTLLAIGLQQEDVKRIFFLQGLMITLVGCVIGLVLGAIVCFVQQRFGIVSMGDNFVTHAFPVAMRVKDFVLTLLLVTAIGASAVAITVKRVQ